MSSSPLPAVTMLLIENPAKKLLWQLEVGCPKSEKEVTLEDLRQYLLVSDRINKGTGTYQTYNDFTPTSTGFIAQKVKVPP